MSESAVTESPAVPGPTRKAVIPAPRRPASREADRATEKPDVLAAMLSASVGSSWTILLRAPDRDTRAGRTVAWISTGIPISEPAPEVLARRVLGEYGYALLDEPWDVPMHRTGNSCYLGCARANAATA